jgi:hypothetical protein
VLGGNNLKVIKAVPLSNSTNVPRRIVAPLFLLAFVRYIQGVSETGYRVAL